MWKQVKKKTLDCLQNQNLLLRLAEQLERNPFEWRAVLQVDNDPYRSNRLPLKFPVKKKQVKLV
jgi:hypothetical protein